LGINFFTGALFLSLSLSETYGRRARAILVAATIALPKWNTRLCAQGRVFNRGN